MAIGMILFGFLSGVMGVIWGAMKGMSVLGMLAMYPVVGMIGALAFVAIALMLPTFRMPTLAGRAVVESR